VSCERRFMLVDGRETGTGETHQEGLCELLPALDKAPCVQVIPAECFVMRGEEIVQGGWRNLEDELSGQFARSLVARRAPFLFRATYMRWALSSSSTSTSRNTEGLLKKRS